MAYACTLLLLLLLLMMMMMMLIVYQHNAGLRRFSQLFT
jgi:hypothetical protein